MRLIVSLPFSLLAGLGLGVCLFPAGSAGPRKATGQAAGPSEPQVSEARPAAAADLDTADAKFQRLATQAASLGQGSNRLGSLYPAIAALSADDFRALRQHPAEFRKFAGQLAQNDLNLGRVVDSLVARWLEVEPESAPQWAGEVFALLPVEDRTRGALLDALSTQRPDVILGLVSAQQDARQRERFINKAMRHLAAKDEAKARAWLETCTAPEERRLAEKQLRIGQVMKNPLGAIDLAAAVDDRNEARELLQQAAVAAAGKGGQALRQLVTTPMPEWMLPAVVYQFADKDPALAIDLMLAVKTPSDPLNQPLQAAFAELAATDRDAALAKMAGLSGKQIGAAVSAIGAQWAARDPAAALAWLARQPKENRADPDRSPPDDDALAATFTQWANRQMPAAQAWAEALPPGELRNAMQAQLARTLAQQGKPAEATQVLAKLGDAVTPKALNEVTRAWTQLDPQAAADWALAQTPGPLQDRVLSSVVETWANSSPKEVENWLAQFPPGETRNQCIAAFLLRGSAWAGTAAEATAAFEAWGSSIDDPWRRTQVARRVYWARRVVNPEEARQWLRSVPGLDTEMVQMALREP